VLSSNTVKLIRDVGVDRLYNVIHVSEFLQFAYNVSRVRHVGYILALRLQTWYNEMDIIITFSFANGSTCSSSTSS